MGTQWRIGAGPIRSSGAGKSRPDRRFGNRSYLCNDSTVHLRLLAAVLFCLALLGARGLGLHFHESDHPAHGEVAGHVHHAEHDQLALTHALDHAAHGEEGVDVDWVGAAAQSMPKVSLFLILLMVAVFIALPVELRWRASYAPLRPPRILLRAGLPPPGRGPPTFS